MTTTETYKLARRRIADLKSAINYVVSEADARARATRRLAASSVSIMATFITKVTSRERFSHSWNPKA